MRLRASGICCSATSDLVVDETLEETARRLSQSELAAKSDEPESLVLGLLKRPRPMADFGSRVPPTAVAFVTAVEMVALPTFGIAPYQEGCLAILDR